MQAVRNIAAVPACELVIMSDANSLFINEILAAAGLTACFSQARAPALDVHVISCKQGQMPASGICNTYRGSGQFPRTCPPAWCLRMLRRHSGSLWLAACDEVVLADSWNLMPTCLHAARGRQQRSQERFAAVLKPGCRRRCTPTRAPGWAACCGCCRTSRRTRRTAARSAPPTSARGRRCPLQAPLLVLLGGLSRCSPC